LECKLCVAACPTGAIGADGHFDFSACHTHNYHEFMGGFTNWVEQIADSPDAQAYRQKVSGAETRRATVTIRNKTISVQDGLVGEPRLRITADSLTWLRLIRKEGGLIWPLLTRKIRLTGSPRLLVAFGKCFPS
jgi:hypothetical protein